MTAATYFDIELDIPDGWRDASTVTLVGPEPDPVTLPRATQPPPRGLPPTFAMRRVPLRGSAAEAIAEIAREQEELVGSLPGARMLSRGTLAVELVQGPAEATTRELELPAPSGPLQQLHVVFALGDQIVAAVGTFSVGPNLGRDRREFLSILTSLR